LEFTNKESPAITASVNLTIKGDSITVKIPKSEMAGIDMHFSSPVTQVP
jgi:hypothetical protein